VDGRGKGGKGRNSQRKRRAASDEEWRIRVDRIYE